jgi:coenzyme F420 hydrogenase subunit beta
MPMNSAASPLIDSIVKNGLCTGCGICEAIAPKGAIQIKINRAGYARPSQKETIPEDSENIIRDVCPGIRIGHPNGVRNYDAQWGPLVGVRAGHAAEKETRRQGSSGGVISALAIHLLQQHEVNFIAQIAVSSTDPLKNELQISRTQEDVLRAAGSRYSPSAPLQSMRELLAYGQKFAFIGKPCDVAALRRYAQYDKRVDEFVPYMLSFMCAGIPSIEGTYELLLKLGVDRSKLKSFRYRGDGWPGMARAITNEDKVFEADYNSSWGTVLNRHLQFRCKICPDGTGEFADVVCADAWYGKDGYPDFAERDGRSLILSRTSKGEALVASVIGSKGIQANELPVKEIARMQPYQVHRKQVVLGRLIATFLARGRAPIYSRMGLMRLALRANKIDWLKNAWGTYRRARGEKQ